MRHGKDTCKIEESVNRWKEVETWKCDGFFTTIKICV